jgi:hypothetical protein
MKLSLSSALLAGLLALGLAAPASAEPLPPECQRFQSEAKPNDLQPRLARLCVRLIDAHDSDEGLSVEEREAAARLGHYLAVIGELDIRRGAIGINGAPGNAAPTTQTARYLIAHRIGLLEIADRLAPYRQQAAMN